MESNTLNENVKLNLTLHRNDYDLLQRMAEDNYIKVATQAKQILMRYLHGVDNNQNRGVSNEQPTN